MPTRRDVMYAPHNAFFYNQPISYSRRTPILVKDMRGGRGICVVKVEYLRKRHNMQTGVNRVMVEKRFKLIASSSIETDRRSWHKPSGPSLIRLRAGLDPTTSMSESSA